MLVPFASNVIGIMTPILGSLVDKLGALLSNYSAAARTDETVVQVQDIWESLQCELALEKFIWGRIQSLGMFHTCYRSLKLYSVNLGPGNNAPSRCATDRLGFLALTRYTETTSSDSALPPFGIWTRAKLQVWRLIILSIWWRTATANYTVM
jgi:hypothetical protein